MFGPGRKSFHGYAAATRWAPQWTVAYLVFKSGAPDLRAGSVTGGGQIYGHEFQGTFQPLIGDYTPGIGSFVGGGQMPALPPYLQALFGGQQGQGS